MGPLRLTHPTLTLKFLIALRNSSKFSVYQQTVAEWL